MDTGSLCKTVAACMLGTCVATGSATAGSLTVSGGLAVYDDDVLDDVIFGPALQFSGRLDNGLFLRGGAMYLEGHRDEDDPDNDNGLGDDEVIINGEAGRYELEAGIAHRAHPWFDVILSIEATHLDRNWGRSRTDGGIALGFRATNNDLETEGQVLYRYPEGSREPPQAGVRLRTGGVISDSGWGAGIEINWLTDERYGLAVMHRRF